MTVTEKIRSVDNSIRRVDWFAEGDCVSQCVGLLEMFVFVYKRVVFPFAFSTGCLGKTVFGGMLIREAIETKTVFLYFTNSLCHCHC